MIPTGIQGSADVEIPSARTITGWTVAGQKAETGAIVVDVWSDTYANYPPTVADTIAGSQKPTITATAAKGQNLSITPWSLTAGNTLRFNVDSVTTFTAVTLTFRGTIP